MEGRLDPRSRERRWRSLLLITLISLGSGEIALRIYNQFQPSFVFFTSSYNRYRGRAFETWFDFRMNSQGFLDTEFGPKERGRYRIIALGDSFGHGVVPYRYNFLTLAEAELQKVRPDVELYNLGIPRIGPREYVALLINEGLAYEPDAILVSLFVGNDLRDAGRDYHQRALYEYSYVASLIRFMFYVAPRAQGVNLPLDHERYDDTAKSIDDEGYRVAKAPIAKFFRENPLELREQVKISVGYLSEIQRVCQSRNLKLLVAVLPDELQLYESLRREFVGDVRDDGVALDLSLPNQLIHEALESARIPYWDLLPSMLEAARTTVLYKPNDTHWNIAGNALAAREITGFMKVALPLDAAPES